MILPKRAKQKVGRRKIPHKASGILPHMKQDSDAHPFFEAWGGQPQVFPVCDSDSESREAIKIGDINFLKKVISKFSEPGSLRGSW